MPFDCFGCANCAERYLQIAGPLDRALRRQKLDVMRLQFANAAASEPAIEDLGRYLRQMTGELAAHGRTHAETGQHAA
jgi:hypothetical protein